jgi:hypothetical protein
VLDEELERDVEDLFPGVGCTGWASRRAGHAPQIT